MPLHSRILRVQKSQCLLRIVHRKTQAMAGALKQIVCRNLVHQPSPIQNPVPRGNFREFIQQMGRNEKGYSFFPIVFQYQISYVPNPRRIQAVDRLVEDDQFGLSQQGNGQP